MPLAASWAHLLVVRASAGPFSHSAPPKKRMRICPRTSHSFGFHISAPAQPSMRNRCIRGWSIANRRAIGYIPNRRIECRSLNLSAGNAGRPLRRSCPHRPPRWPARNAQAPKWKSFCPCSQWGERHALLLPLSQDPAALVAPLNAECVAWSRPILDFGFAILDLQSQPPLPPSGTCGQHNPISKI